eukprot:6206947-Pleurochrysis_carterae.AAC.3
MGECAVAVVSVGASASLVFTEVRVQTRRKQARLTACCSSAVSSLLRSESHCETLGRLSTRPMLLSLHERRRGSAQRRGTGRHPRVRLRGWLQAQARASSARARRRVEDAARPSTPLPPTILVHPVTSWITCLASQSPPCEQCGPCFVFGLGVGILLDAPNFSMLWALHPSAAMNARAPSTPLNGSLSQILL